MKLPRISAPLIFLLHIAIALIAFSGFWHHPGNTIFFDIGDGLKNIFTLVSYVKEPVHESLFRYHSFQYPFGDYIYYTDNDPLLAMPLKWFCHHIYDISAYSIILLNLTVILNIAVCGALVFSLFQRITGNRPISFLMALMLPWINMQVLRIWAGHYAFSYSSFTLIAIWLVVLWDKYKYSRRRQLLIACAMCAFSVLSFLAQGYYIAITTFYMASSLFIYGLYTVKWPIGRRAIITAIAYAIAAFACVLALVALTDSYLPLRREGANGYDWMMQKVRVTALFSAYDFQHFSFPFRYGAPHVADPESAAYLGNVGLYALLLLAALMLRTPWRRSVMQAQRTFFKDPLKGSLFLGSLVMLFISMGEHYYTGDAPGQGVHIINFMNPMYYIHFFTKRVEQFRSLERFIWPFYFCFYLWISYTLAFLIQQYGKNFKIAVTAAIVLLGGAEVADYIIATRQRCNNPNPFSEQALAKVKPHIPLTEYQAILPIPYYFAGSEDYDYTLNDTHVWSRETYQLSYMTGLPLMACKMSRTPPVYNKMLMDMVTRDTLWNELKMKLTTQPVLVMVNRKISKDSTQYNVPDPGTPLAALYWQATQFAERNKLQPVDSVGDVVYYKWLPKG